MQDPSTATPIDPVPQAQLQPVGLTAAETASVMAAAVQVTDGVRWVAPMPGFRPDAYVTHLRAVDLPGDPAANTPLLPPHKRANRLLVDDQGRHGGRPVCMLGTQETTHSEWRSEQPDALGELAEALRFAAAQLMPQRVMYTLARLAWDRRKQWKTHQFHLQLEGRLLAVVEPVHWRMSVRKGVAPKHLEQARMLALPLSAPVPSSSLQYFPMTQALWTLAQRCDASSLPGMLPTSFLTARLTRRHNVPVPINEAGQHCLAVLDALDMTSMNAAELRTTLELPEPVLMRALTCLALGRAIRHANGEGRPSRLSAWLPASWRQSLASAAGELD